MQSFRTCERKGEPQVVCQHCGSAVAPGVARCPSCGTPVLRTVDPDVTYLSPASSAACGTSGSTVVQEGPLHAGQEIGSRYRVLRLLGLGGMGAVYEAWDEELGMSVALKVIRAELVADPAMARVLERRFKEELRIGRQVTHENVVRIHDLGHVDGILYITMPYIEGEDLASIVARERVLTVGRTMKIARTMIAGLAAAHAAGVVHRDLKPANIMITSEGAAMIMDFGVARSTSGRSLPSYPGGAAGTVAAAQTVAGAIMGTIEYMAPEQARGVPVDQRADVYAFGLILYDLLVGRHRAEQAGSAVAELQARMEEQPPAAKSLVPEIPEALDRIISRCIEPDREKRFKNAGELAAALNRLDDNGVPIPIKRVFGVPVVAAVIALAIVLLATTWYFGRSWRAPIEHEPVSVLVADFDNKTGDTTFNGAVEQALGIGLEKASFVSVVPRKDAQALALQLSPGSQGHVTNELSLVIARRQGTKIVVSGSIQPLTRGYRLHASLLDASTGKAMRSLDQTITTRDQALPAIETLAAKLRALLGETASESAKVAQGETFTAGSLAAMQAYARGQQLAAIGRREEALKAYEDAISADPNFGRAYAGMGVVYFNLKQFDKSEEAYQKALKHLDRMTERERLRTLGGYLISVPRNYVQAVETFRELVKKYPTDNIGYSNLALAHFYLHQFAEAKEIAMKGIELSPDNVMQHSNLASYAMYAGDFATAIAEADKVLKANPKYDLAWLTRGLSHLASGESAAALQDYAKLGETGARGAALQNTAEADLALSEGRYRDAVRVLAPGIEAVRHTNATGDLAQKYIAAAEASLGLGLKVQAADYASKARALGKDEAVLFPAALVLIETGHEGAAQEIAGTLESQLQAQTASYARLIDAKIALTHGRFGYAIEAIREAQKRYDSWFSRFLLGRAYLDAGPTHAAEALKELTQCVNRRGEVTDVFLANTPSVRYLPPMYYWLARAQEAVGSSAEAKKTYNEFLTRRPAPDTTDNLVTDARRRAK
ncbi:MAG TPA: protein kinase [Vicinamibacterales bacterium]|nr:protein kinase [Vicinamibacterales bacterium]